MIAKMKLKFGFHSSLKKNNDMMPSFTYSIMRHLVTHPLKREIVFCPFLFCGVYTDIKPALFPFYTAKCSVNHAKRLLKKKNQVTKHLVLYLSCYMNLPSWLRIKNADMQQHRERDQQVSMALTLISRQDHMFFFLSIFILKIMDSETCCNFVKWFKYK
jgi:hypothetical protein